jgi:hypothetical protein
MNICDFFKENEKKKESKANLEIEIWNLLPRSLHCSHMKILGKVSRE